MMLRWSDTSPETLVEIAVALQRGEVLLLPTDTIYGLHGLADDARVASRIADIKGRDETKPFVVLASDIDQIAALGAVVPPILNDLWPAPLTAILPRGGKSIAVRIPALEWLRSLVMRSGPIVSTSANRSGEPPIREPHHLAHELQIQLDGLLDLGPREGEPSAIVDFTGDPVKLVREGEPAFTQKLRKTLWKSL